MHTRVTFFWVMAVLTLTIAGLHFLANQYYLYFEWWWFDIVMHFLGGALFGLGSLWFLRYEVPIFIRKKIPAFLFSFATVLVVGILWEWFEFLTDMYAAANYTLDTALDLSMNMAGMLSAYVIFSRYGQ